MNWGWGGVWCGVVGWGWGGGGMFYREILLSVEAVRFISRNFSIVMKLGGLLGITTAMPPVKYQSDVDVLTSNLPA